MTTFSLSLRRITLVFTATTLIAGVHAAAPNSHSQPSQATGTAKSADTRATLPRLAPTPALLWHEVADRQNNRLGDISDILVEMPSGRIAFFAINPSELFERPRVLPPGALEPAGNGTLKLKGSIDAWYNAPLLSANRREVDAVTQHGLELRGYYESGWAPLPAAPSRGAAVIGQPAPNHPPSGYVSLRDLQNLSVLDAANQKIGAIGDFLVDWPHQRVAYAIVSQQEPSIVGAVSSGFAIPVALLMPPNRDQQLVANVPSEMLQQAPRLTSASRGIDAPPRVFRYSAHTVLASNSR